MTQYYAEPENKEEKVLCKVVDGIDSRKGYVDVWIGSQRVGIVCPDGALYLCPLEKRDGLWVTADKRLMVRHN